MNKNRMMDDEISVYVPPVKLVTQQSDADLILQALHDEVGTVRLSVKLMNKKIRLTQVRDWIYKYVAKRRVVRMVMNETWKDVHGADYKVTEAVANRDYDDAYLVYAPEPLRKPMLVDILLENLMDIYNKCMAGDKRDLKTAKDAMKQFDEVITKHFGDHTADLYKSLNIQPSRLAFQPELLPNSKLPDNWEDIRDKLMKEDDKFSLDDIAEANVVEDGE
jgi:hypothetical protein